MSYDKEKHIKKIKNLIPFIFEILERIFNWKEKCILLFAIIINNCK